MHLYDQDHHFFTIRSCSDNASASELIQTPALVLDSHFIYRKIPPLHDTVPSASAIAKFGRLVTAATAPARSYIDLATEPVISIAPTEPKTYDTVQPEILINSAFQQELFPHENFQHGRPKDWKLYCIHLSARTLELVFVHHFHLGNNGNDHGFHHVAIKLQDVAILQMACHLQKKLSDGSAYAEHYSCITRPQVYQTDGPSSFHVTYDSGTLAPNDSEDPSATDKHALPKYYTHSSIVYEDSCIS